MYYEMYYGTVVHTIVRTTTKNASTYYSHDVLQANTKMNNILKIALFKISLEKKRQSNSNVLKTKETL